MSKEMIVHNCSPSLAPGAREILRLCGYPCKALGKALVSFDFYLLKVSSTAAVRIWAAAVLFVIGK